MSLAAGNATLWKPSPTTPLCAVATTKIIAKVLEQNGVDGAVAGLVCGGKDVGEAVVGSPAVDMGKRASYVHYHFRILTIMDGCSLVYWQ